MAEPRTFKDTVPRLQAEIERLRTTQVELRTEMYGEVASRDAKIERLHDAIRWACGEQPDADGRWFGDHEPAPTKRPRPYWWRTPLRRLSGIDEQEVRTE